jgi:hypothetical protein
MLSSLVNFLAAVRVNLLPEISTFLCNPEGKILVMGFISAF